MSNLLCHLCAGDDLPVRSQDFSLKTDKLDWDHASKQCALLTICNAQEQEDVVLFLLEHFSHYPGT